jgi:hypothetical protein
MKSICRKVLLHGEKVLLHGEKNETCIEKAALKKTKKT